MKSLAVVCLGSLLICNGCGAARADESNAATSSRSSVAAVKPGRETPEEKQYRERFLQISSELGSAPKPDQDGDPARFLADLKVKHDKERDVIDALTALKPPPKFKEFHEVLLEWKKERWALDEEGIGYLADKQNQKVDELSTRIDEVEGRYAKKIGEIVKSHGYNSIDKFLGVR